MTVVTTEWRSKYFKKMASQDAKNTQVATDSLLNFETVKYFNAEDHEQERFYKALWNYKMTSVTVAYSMVVLNMLQGAMTNIGLALTLFYVYSQITIDKFAVSDFVVMNMYIIQLYMQLYYLGSFWRFIRQNWTDVELVLEYLDTDQMTKESPNPLKANIHSGEIVFKNVNFTYDDDKPKDQQRQILHDLSFKVPAG